MRLRAKESRVVSFNTPTGPLTVDIAWLHDDRIAILESDEEHGSLPLVGPYTPGPIPKPVGGSPGLHEWLEWTATDYDAFAYRVNNHPARHRELPTPIPL